MSFPGVTATLEERACALLLLVQLPIFRLFLMRLWGLPEPPGELVPLVMPLKMPDMLRKDIIAQRCLPESDRASGAWVDGGGLDDRPARGGGAEALAAILLTAKVPL